MCTVAAAPGRPVSESKRLCHGDEGHEWSARRPVGVDVAYSLRNAAHERFLGRRDLHPHGASREFCLPERHADFDVGRSIPARKRAVVGGEAR